MRRYHVTTFGCQMNAHDSERIKGLLEELGLSDDEIVDVALAAAARCFFSKALDALGVQPDSEYLQLDDDLRGALTVGRPIAGT